MDTTTETALSKAHKNLATDLANCSQLIDPLNSQALATLYQAQRRLEDIGELVRSDTVPKVDDYKAPEGFIGGLTEDTLAHVSDVLVVLSNVDYKDCGGEEFACGMLKILSNAWNALEFEKGRVGALRAQS
jgi:hypothetical protein